MNNYFEDMFNIQKNMMDSWKNVFSKQNLESENYLNFKTYFDNMMKMSEQVNSMFYKGPEGYKEVFRNSFPYVNEYANNIYKMNEMIFKSPSEVWNDLNRNSSRYFEDLYKTLTDNKNLTEDNLNKFLDDMQKEYMNYTKEFFASYLDKDFINSYEEMLSNFNEYQKTLVESVKPWSKLMEYDEIKKALEKGPSAYYEFLREYNLRFLESFKVIESSKYSSYIKNQIEFQKLWIQRIDEYNKIVSDYYQEVFDVLKESTKKVFEDYKNDIKEGLDKKTFEEFYDFSKVKSNEYIGKAVKGEEYNRILKATISSYKNFIKSQDEIMKKLFEIFNETEEEKTDLKENVEELND